MRLDCTQLTDYKPALVVGPVVEGGRVVEVASLCLIAHCMVCGACSERPDAPAVYIYIVKSTKHFVCVTVRNYLYSVPDLFHQHFSLFLIYLGLFHE